ncbi:helix-turn-helix domain-containing protein [Gammaproteobacteria bacterium]|nr:helix-turn-helix domain-containing protein [Gammaproteobacteria bacterium]
MESDSESLLLAKAISYGRLVVSNVAELDSDIDGAYIRHAQLSGGEFEGRLQRVALEGSTFDSGLFNQHVCGAGTMAADAYTFVFLPAHADSGHLNKSPLVNGVWVYRPGDEIYGTIPAEFRWFTFGARQTMIEERLETVGVDPSILRKFGAGPLATRTDLKHLQGTIQRVYCDSQVPGDIGDADIVEEKLAFAFIDAVGETPSRHSEFRNQHPVLKRATDMLHTFVDRPITTTILCQHLRCSRRQIETEFKSSYGMGPIAYHRRLRLNEARRRLLVEELSHGAISVAAQDSGFTHLGRFSVDYKLLFGESPRQTLQRSR